MADDAKRPRNRRDDHVAAGYVSAEEAHEILSRFISSHFRKVDREKARFSIPANPKRDDDIRLSAFIEQYARLVAAAKAIVARFEEFSTWDLPDDEWKANWMAESEIHRDEARALAAAVAEIGGDDGTG